jgi:hypothetical protein
MNKYKKRVLSVFVSSVILALCCKSYAVPAVAQMGNGEPPVSVQSVGQAPGTQDIDEPILKELSDQLHLIENSLNNRSSAHYYGFTALRGQKVILSTPTGAPSTKAWKVEYHEGGGWKTKQDKEPIVFSSLLPGDFVIVRVTHKQSGSESESGQKLPYSIALGSYPVMSDVKWDVPTISARVPVTDTSRSLGTQTHSELTFRAKFTDSTNAPLKGGLAMLRIFLVSTSTQPDLTKYVLSDENGFATLDVALDKCYGGEMTSQRNAVDSNLHYWDSEYNVGGWYAFDGVIGNESLRESAKYVSGFAHICRQTLMRGRVDRW